MTARTLDFRQVIERVGYEFQARLDKTEIYRHPTGVGDSREDLFRDYLTEVLPPRFTVDRGKIIDSLGNLSAEFDVIISERSEVAPGMNFSDRRLVPIESVYAVFEVKSLLNREAFDQFTESVRSLDAFKRFFIPTQGRGITVYEDPRWEAGLGPQEMIPGVGIIISGIVAFDGPQQSKTLAEYLKDAHKSLLFICIPERELITSDLENDDYSSVQIGISSLPIMLWSLMGILTTNRRPDVFIPDYTKYREAYIRSLGEDPSCWSRNQLLKDS